MCLRQKIDSEERTFAQNHEVQAMEKLNEIVSIITIIIIHYNIIQQEIKNIHLNYLYGELMWQTDAGRKEKEKSLLKNLSFTSTQFIYFEKNNLYKRIKEYLKRKWLEGKSFLTKINSIRKIYQIL